MKVLLQCVLLGCLSCCFCISFAQERYLDEVFSEVQVTENVKYGENYSILPIILGTSDQPMVVDLFMDVYEPAGDTMSNRPVVIVAHAGDFLPPIINQTPYGDKQDSAFVAFCMNFARRGFVAASVGYRTGWNPLSPDEIVRRKGVFEASVRAAQDLRTAVRYFRKSVEEDENPFGIDPDKFAMGGEDAGTYSTMNVGYLETFSEALLPKFFDFSTQPPTFFVDTLLFGDFYGEVEAPLNVPNHVGYSSEVDLVWGMEGGIAEFDWVKEEGPAMVGVLNTHQYERVGIRDETIQGDIILATSAYMDTAVYRAAELGLNDAFENEVLQADPLTQLMMERSGGIPGMLVTNTPIREGEIQCDPTAGAAPNTFGRSGDPWNWFDEDWFKTLWALIPAQTIPADVRLCQYTTGNPNDAELAKTYVDTISQYLAPRIVLAMGIEGTSLGDAPVSTHELLGREVGLQVYPNPTQGSLAIEAKERIQQAELLSIEGKLLEQIEVNAFQGEINRSDLPTGMYLLRLNFDKGQVVQKVLWD
ncbi:MAG: T9SS type A sorting domain-containing protein [Bacteroidota bacterium]